MPLLFDDNNKLLFKMYGVVFLKGFLSFSDTW